MFRRTTAKTDTVDQLKGLVLLGIHCTTNHIQTIIRYRQSWRRKDQVLFNWKQAMFHLFGPENYIQIMLAFECNELFGSEEKTTEQSGS